MSNELHLWTAGTDPYIFTVAGVIVYVHAGTPARGGVGGGDPAVGPVWWDPGNTDVAAYVQLNAVSWDPGQTDVVSVAEADVSSRPTLASVLDDIASAGTTRFTYQLEEGEESARIASLLGGLRQAGGDDLAIHVVPPDVPGSGATYAADWSDRGSRDG